MSLWQRLKAGIKKTHDTLNTDIRDLFKREGRLVDDDFLRELQDIMIKTDLGFAASQKVVDDVRAKFRARKEHMESVVDSVKSSLVELLKQDGSTSLNVAESGPTVIMVVGVNGSGKTTSIAKLTKLLADEGNKVVLGAGDTFRAAAVEQLTIWADRCGAEIVTGPQGSDPASVAFKAVAKALEIDADICIVDTAGRLQTQQHLMQELEKIHRVLGKQIPDAPHEVLLVLDATTGQPGISQAIGFTEAVHCTGIILAKLDGTAKGGVIVPIRQQVGLPVKYIGVGEKADDIQPFDPELFADAMFEGLTGSPAGS